MNNEPWKPEETPGTPLESTTPAATPIPEPQTVPVDQQGFISQQPVASEKTATPITETVTPTTPFVATPPPKKPKMKRSLLLTIIIAGAVVLLGGGGAAAYAFYYQNPQKVLADALSQTIEAKTLSYTGTIDYKDNEDANIKLTLDGKNTEEAGTIAVTADIQSKQMTLTVKGAGQFDKDGNLYFKLQDVKELVAKALASDGTDFDTTPFDSVINEVDNHWVKISADDLKEYSEDYAKQQTCTTDALDSYGKDANAKKEVTKLYQDNEFLKLDKKLGSKTINGTGSIGFAYTVNNDAMKTFFKKFEDTSLGKKLKACDTSSSETTIAEDADNDVNRAKITAEVWVARFGHTPTELTVAAKDDENDVKATLNPVLNKDVTIETPTDTLTLKKIGEDLTKAYTDYYLSSYSTAP